MISFLKRLFRSRKARRNLEIPFEITRTLTPNRVFKGPPWYREVRTFESVVEDTLNARRVESPIPHTIRCRVYSASREFVRQDGSPSSSFLILGESVEDATSIAGVLDIVGHRLDDLVDLWGLPKGKYRAEIFALDDRNAVVERCVFARGTGKVDPLRN